MVHETGMCFLNESVKMGIFLYLRGHVFMSHQEKKYWHTSSNSHHIHKSILLEKEKMIILISIISIFLKEKDLDFKT